MNSEYQPKTGLRCSCKAGIERDNCPACEGTGWQIDFAKIRARRTEPELFAAAPFNLAGEILDGSLTEEGETHVRAVAKAEANKAQTLLIEMVDDRLRESGVCSC